MQAVSQRSAEGGGREALDAAEAHVTTLEAQLRLANTQVRDSL